MDCNSICQSYNPEDAVAILRNLSPKANSGVALNHDTDWTLDDFDAPLFFDVWPLTHNLILKISSVLVLRHDVVFVEE